MDGTLIQAWASHKSFVRKDGHDQDGDNFKGKPRNNDTHASRTDDDARLYCKGNTGSELRCMGEQRSRQVMVLGLQKVDQIFLLTMAAYNLTIVRTLGQIRPEAAQKYRNDEKYPDPIKYPIRHQRPRWRETVEARRKRNQNCKIAMIGSFQ